MVPGEVDILGQRVVQIGEANAVLCTHRLTDDNLVDVIKLIPILISVMGRGKGEGLNLMAYNITCKY